jgi:hypothetical protein
MRQFRTFRERQARLDAWRERARILLAESLPSDDQRVPDVAGLANTIVGMFDAGARDEEVIAFLREAETRHFGAERLSTSSRQVLARTLRRAAADAGE